MDEDLRGLAIDVTTDLHNWIEKASAALQRKDQREAEHWIYNIADTSKLLLDRLQKSPSHSPQVAKDGDKKKNIKKKKNPLQDWLPPNAIVPRR